MAGYPEYPCAATEGGRWRAQVIGGRHDGYEPEVVSADIRIDPAPGTFFPGVDLVACGEMPKGVGVLAFPSGQIVAIISEGAPDEWYCDWTVVPDEFGCCGDPGDCGEECL